MAGNTTTLQEFLVTIRTQVDEASQTKANSSLGLTKKGVFALGAAASALTYASLKFGKSWVDNTAKTQIAIDSLGIKSIAQFKSMQLAAEQVGIAGDDIVASFDKIKQMKFELGAGATSLFKIISPNITEAMDPNEILREMAFSIRDMKAKGVPTTEIYARGTAAGLEPEMVRRMYDGIDDFTNEVENFDQSLVGWEKKNTEGLTAAQQAKDLARQRAENKAALSGAVVSSDLVNTLMEEYQRYNDSIGTLITAATYGNDARANEALRQEILLGDIKDEIKEGFGIAGNVAKAGWDVFLNQDLGTQIGLGIGAAAVASGPLSNLFKLGKGAVGLGAAGLGALGSFGTTLGVGAAGLGGWWTGGKINEWYEDKYKSTIGSDIYDKVHDKSLQGKTYGLFHSSAGIDKSVLQTLMNEGLDFKSATDILANFKAESGMNPFVTGDKGSALGLAQWHSDRQSEYTKLFGHTMESVADSATAIEEQSKFAAYEILKGKERGQWKKAHEEHLSGSLYSRYIERPKRTEAEAINRGKVAEQLQKDYASMNITINVQGTTDPERTAQLVAQKQQEIARYKQSFAQ